MNYIVKVFWMDKDYNRHNEYYEYMSGEDARRRVESWADELRAEERDGEIDGFSVLLYELVDY